MRRDQKMVYKLNRGSRCQEERSKWITIYTQETMKKFYILSIFGVNLWNNWASFYKESRSRIFQFHDN